MDHINGKHRFLCLSLCLTLLAGLMFASSSHKVLAQSSDRFDIAYEYQGNIYLTGFENNEIIYHGPLTSDSEGGNVNASWSPDGRYLMFTHYDFGNPSLRILDTLNNNQFLAEISGACCGAWHPYNGTIAYVNSSERTLVIASPDNNSQSILWYLNDGLEPFGRGAYAPDGTLFFSFGQGDAATQVWAIHPDGQTEMVAASATYSDNPWASNVLSDPAISSDGQLSITLDTSALGYAPGGPVTLIGYAGISDGGFGRWQVELFGGKSVSWAPQGQRFAWEEWVSCSETGIDAPGFCKGGIGIMDVNTGKSNLILPGVDYFSPAWRPSIPVIAPISTTPPPVVETQPPLLPPESSATVAPIEPAVIDVGSPFPNDGYSPVNFSKSFFAALWEKIIPPVEAAYSPDECQAQLAGPDKKYEGQCTWFVGYYRPDVCDWGGGNAYEWAGRAEANGAKYKVTVRTKPQPGDIAVWIPTTEGGCGGTTKVPPSGPCTEVAPNVWEGCGHVAYVVSVSTDGSTMRIREGNWRPDRSDIQDIPILSCMKFVSQPSLDKKTSLPSTPSIVQTPIPPGFFESVRSWWCRNVGIGCNSSW
ncbi:MAG: CHAP domain-containing protein [Chloroflexi bacterium]|nr:CHAP domain-containing protein [Chloroflexota bacterium]